LWLLVGVVVELTEEEAVREVSVLEHLSAYQQELSTQLLLVVVVQAVL
jgi:hypothetical protein